MYNLGELKKIVENERRKRLLQGLKGEGSDANQMIFSQFSDRYEAVYDNHTDRLFLVPGIGTLGLLFRGQGREWIPSYPSLYRGNPSVPEIFIWRLRLIQFKRLLKSHPVVTGFFEKNNFNIDIEGLAQHYGLITSVMDLTSNLDVALFFAMCPYDQSTDTYSFHDDDNQHKGHLYVFIPLLDNRPYPSNSSNIHRIMPIGLQPFLRPAVQYGYGLRMEKNESIACWKYDFTFTGKDSLEYYNKFLKGKSLWIKDELVDKTWKIKYQKTFSESVFEETYNFFKPQGYTKKAIIKAIARLGVAIISDKEDLTFSDDEKRKIIEKWNNETGPKMAQKIVRNQWFNHDGIVDNKILNIHNRHEYMSFERYHMYDVLRYMANPQPLKGAQWINYQRRTLKQDKIIKSSNGWKEIEASMHGVFGKPWLKEEDWKIPVI